MRRAPAPGVPSLRALDPGSRAAGVANLLAGISVALVLIPQSLAYAEIAAVPPEVGLYSAALVPLVASLFVSSPYLQVGPVALTSLLTLGALSGHAAEGTAEYVALAGLLAVIVGGTRLLLGLLRLGRIAYLMSDSVVLGFTSAAAILIAGSQLPGALGVPRPDGGVLRRAAWALTHPDSWSGEAIALSVVTILIALGSRRIHRLFPGVLLAVIGALVYSIVTDYSGETVGELPNGFLDFTFDFPFSEFWSLLIPGVVIAVIGFAEPASISRTFAQEEGQGWDASRELASSGIANLTSAISGGMPVGGSFSRSSLGRLAGATTPLAGAVTGVTVLLFLPFANVLADLPRAVLSAIVISAVVPLIRIPAMTRLVRIAPVEAFKAWLTFAATLATAPHVERGVIIGVVVSLLTDAVVRRQRSTTDVDA